MARSGGLVRKSIETVERYTGLEVVRRSDLTAIRGELVEATEDVGTLRREMSRLGYSDMNYAGSQPHELTPRARLNVVQKARVAWAEDPQAGAIVDLKNAFVFGRGVPRPQAFDEEVQDVIDMTWKDPQNRRILTSHAKLMEKGVDLALQCNVFFLFFADGEDGRVRMSIAEHDTIVDAIRHPDERQRILYYKGSRRDVRWDWGKGQYVVSNDRPRIVYYEALDAFAMDLEEAVQVSDLEDGGVGAPPAQQLMPGLLYHVAVNKGTEAIFGTPRFKRLLRWFTAYEQTMRSAVDLMKAAASVYMKADVRGGRQQVERASYQEVRRASPLTQLAVGEYAGGGFSPTPPPSGPGVIYENGAITHSPFSLDPHAADSATVAGQARMQIAAGTFPMHYLGDQSQSNLATSSSVELPVLKIVEEEQEVWEGVFRTLADLAIKRAVDTGLLSEDRDPTDDELERMKDSDPDPITAEVTPGEKIDGYDEATGKITRDLGYNFALPNPLKRVLGDLVAAVSTIAEVFDPTNQNVALSRFLLGLVLEQAFDVSDPKRVVDEVFPSNYAPPKPAPTVVHLGPDGKPVPAPGSPEAAAAAGGAVGADGKRHPASNPYGAMKSSAGAKNVQETMDSWGVTREEMTEILEAAAVKAHRGLRPRPDDPTFQRYSEEFLAATDANLRELVERARSSEGSTA